MNVESSSRSISGLVVVSRSANTCRQVIPAVGRFASDAGAAVGTRHHDTAPTKSCADSGLVRPNLWESGSTWFVDEGGLR